MIADCLTNAMRENDLLCVHESDKLRGVGFTRNNALRAMCLYAPIGVIEKKLDPKYTHDSLSPSEQEACSSGSVRKRAITRRMKRE